MRGRGGCRCLFVGYLVVGYLVVGFLVVGCLVVGSLNVGFLIAKVPISVFSYEGFPKSLSRTKAKMIIYYAMFTFTFLLNAK